MAKIPTKTDSKKMKYPIYIVSKGRAKTPMTANLFKKFGIDFMIVVEPQEYQEYCDEIGKQYVLELPFSNLGLGSYPARNFCWEHSIEQGYEKHWVFDDNIRNMRRVINGKRIPVNPGIAIQCTEDFIDRYQNVAIGAFNYYTFVVPGQSDKKPFNLNVHCYSAMLIDNNLPFRWRLKYNEDIDLCLQALHNNYATILINAFIIDKISTSQKMSGGNQTELYQNNAEDKKILKARSLQEIWKNEGYVEVIKRYGRPHHWIEWKKHFNIPLIKKTNFDSTKIEKINNYGMELKVIKPPKNKHLLNIVEQLNQQR